MKRQIVGWDIETTGLDKEKCSILQIAFIKYDFETKKEVERLVSYIKPNKKYEIEAGAFEKHGITKEKIEAEGVSFESVADRIIEFCEGCELVTYNGNNYDVPILNRHFNEISKNFPFKSFTFWDAYKIEMQVNSHKLNKTYERYFGSSFENAHDAGADVDATVKVFFAQLEQYNVEQRLKDGDIELETKIEFPDGFFKRNSEGKIEYAVGKYKGREFMEVIKEDLQYSKWAISIQNTDTKKILQDYFTANR